MKPAAVGYDNGDGRIRGARGVEIRAAFLRAHPLCAHCKDRGVIRVATEVDHIVPLHAQGPDTWENRQALCKDCHRAKTNMEQGASTRAQMFPLWLKPAACHLTIVFGPPGSGKSTLVHDRAAADDTVIDLDAIMAQVSGLPVYHAGGQWLNRAVRERNRMLGELKRSHTPAWFVVTGMGQADRQWWQRTLVPTSVVVLDTPERECIARIKADARRPAQVKAKHIEAVHQWWHAERGYAARSARKVAIGMDGWPA